MCYLIFTVILIFFRKFLEPDPQDTIWEKLSYVGPLRNQMLVNDLKNESLDNNNYIKTTMKQFRMQELLQMA